jgi:hypothetical protein
MNLNLYTMKTVTIPATSATLPSATMFNLTLPSDTMRIALIPVGDVYWNIGTASAATAKIPSSGIEFPVTKTVANTIQLFAINVQCDIIVYNKL